MLNIYLCDDETVQLSCLKKQIEKYLVDTKKEAVLVSAETNPEKTLKEAKSNPDAPSLFFIDVVLDGYCVDGFWLMQELLKINNSFEFVFLTSHQELAYKVFDKGLKVVDYLVKSPDLFLDEALSAPVFNRLEQIFYKVEKKTKDKKNQICFECGKRKIYVDPKDIVYIQALKDRRHYFQVHCLTTQFITRSTMAQLLELLGDHFIGISRTGPYCLFPKRRERNGGCYGQWNEVFIADQKIPDIM